ncbi:hypothetical protein LptCag_0060 [Leptospirillum ferriphilum]|uniref:Uncharacterized protein n=1 Tax=Leptospirillum ferriphilum TaxID=178606 RepID=A0A094WCR6_9BACT|nr:hypothetical protein LptCag_0060 [Leptospirillum ferriphilum]
MHFCSFPGKGKISHPKNVLCLLALVGSLHPPLFLVRPGFPTEGTV